jgi:hypothetical protein
MKNSIFRICPVLFLVVVTGFPFARTKAQEPRGPDSEKIHPLPEEYALDVFLPHIWQGTKASFARKESLIALGIGSAATALVHTQDEKIDDYWHAEDPLGDTAFIGDNWGAGYIQAAACLGMYGWAWHKDNQNLATTAEVLTEAMIIQMLAINTLKYVVGRERPDEQDNLSFPSGHTGAAFTMAAVIDHRYGHKWGIPLYALAVFTGLERMQDHMHYASDVTMGATIAMTVGYQTSRYHDDYPYKKVWHQEKIDEISILPYSPDGKAFGMMLTMPLK